MKKLFNKIKETIKSIYFKATMFTFLIFVLIAFPIVVSLITILKQYSIITSFFWIAIYVILVLFILLLCSVSVIFEKIINNYEDKKVEKGYYLDIFKKELLGPFGICIFLVVTIIYLDQLSKLLSIINLTNKGSVDFINGLINFRLAYNKGAAWSMCSEHTDYLAILSLVASFVIIYFLKDFNLKDRKIYSIALTFVLGGTVGNMIDRFFRAEGVVDFIEIAFMKFPIFNLADSFLVVGTIMLMFDLIILDYLRTKKKKTEHKIESLEENNND